MRDGQWSTARARRVGFTTPGLLDHASTVSVTRELASALPGQAGAAGAADQATGRVDISTQDPGTVSTRVGTPFTRRQWPQSGDPVAVDVTDGENTHRVFTGKVDGSVSGFASSEAQADLVDATDAFTSQVSHNAVFRSMPPLSTTGGGRPRMTGLLGAFPVHLAARAAGFYASPAPDGYTILSAPLMGSTWPERGVLRDSSRHDDVGAWNNFHPGAAAGSSGTVYMSQILADYEPDPYQAPWTGGITTPRPMNITLGVGPNQATSSYLAARWSTAAGMREIRLSVTSNRNLAGQIVIDGDATTVAYLSGNNAGAFEYVTLRIERMPGSDLRFTIHTDTGATATGVSNIGGADMRNTMWNHARLYAPTGCWVNGAMISYTSEPPAATRFTRTFLYHPDSPLQSMEVMPALVSETAGSILGGQAEAECASVWLDEDGRLRWLGRQRMLAQDVTRTLTSTELADARITLDAQDVRKKVTVKHTQWAVRTAKRSTIIVHEGASDEYTDGDRVEKIIATPGDEQWVQVDTRLSTIYGGTGATAFNRGEGSWHGYTVLTPDGDEFSQSNYTQSTYSFAPIGPGAFKWSFHLISLPGSANKVKTATRSEDGSSLKPHYRGRGLPLLRAMGVATSADAAVSSATRGPSWAPELVYDVGWHIQSEDRAQELADRVAVELASPKPRITNLDILPDPRIQLADKIRVQEPARTGLEIVGIVTGITQTVGPGEHTMTLDLMVLSVGTPFVTFTDFDGWYHGMRVSEVDALFDDDSFAQHDAEPLRK